CREPGRCARPTKVVHLALATDTIPRQPGAQYCIGGWCFLLLIRASEPVILFTRDRPAAPTASGPYGPPLTPRRPPKRGGTSRTGQALPPARPPTRLTRSRCSRRDPGVAHRAGSRGGARRAPRAGTATRDGR